MTQKQIFRAFIEDPGGGGANVTVPFDVEQIFGKKRVKIKATIDGVPYRGLLVRMGGPHQMLRVLKHIREQIGKSFGDEVLVELEEDLDPRMVEAPPDLKQALDANPQAQAFFSRLSYTHQKEYIQWVAEAKREETRHDCIHRTIQMLLEGKREH